MKNRIIAWFILAPAAIGMLLPSSQAPGIHEAAQKGDLAAVKAFVEKDPESVGVKDPNGRTALHWACRGVHPDVVRYLLEHGADVNARDQAAVTPLHSVSSRGHLEAAQALIAAGARLDAKMADQSTPLHLAAANGHKETALFLFEKGAPVDVQDGKEDTPLHAAAWGDRWDIVGLLADRISAGGRASLNKPDFDGHTLLHIAGRAGRLDAVEQLIAAGAGLDLRNARGQTAYNLAQAGGFGEVAASLARAGADQSPQEFPALSGPYMGQTPPGKIPLLFAKGIISTRLGMYGTIVFSPDGREAFWKPEDTKMMTMKQSAGVWSPPQPFTVAGKESVNVPFFSRDGRRLYFMAGNRNAQGIVADEELWFVEKTGSGWSEPKPFDPVVNAAEMHWQFSMDESGDVYFNAAGGINRARFENGRYLAPSPLPPPINEKIPEEMKYRAGNVGPFVSPKGDYLIFTKFPPIRLFVSFKNAAGNWSEPLDLSEKIQSGGQDSMAKVTLDGKYLFFQCVRPGSGASRGLYWVDASAIEKLRPKPRK